MMASILHHAPHETFRPTSQKDDHLHFFGSPRSPRYCERQDNDNPAGKDLARIDPSLHGGHAVFLVFVGDGEATARTESSAHETNQPPALTPDHTVTQGTPAGGFGTSTRWFPLPASDRISQHDPPQERNPCMALPARKARPAAMYPVSPPPLLLQIRASRKHGHQTGHRVRTIREPTHPPCNASRSSNRVYGSSSSEVYDFPLLYAQTFLLSTYFS